MDGYDWAEIFAGCVLDDGRPIRVVQCGWEDLNIMCETHSRMEVVVDIGQRLLRRHCNLEGHITICPDFVLVRNEVRTADVDYRNQLFGLMYGDVPSCNSLSSVYSFLERPIVHAELTKLNKRLGDAVFPVVPQCYFSTFRSMMYVWRKSARALCVVLCGGVAWCMWQYGRYMVLCGSSSSSSSSSSSRMAGGDPY